MTSWMALRVVVFSSRRRHTRFDCDWSSDVCSSDLFENDNQRKGEALYRGNKPTSRLQAGLERVLGSGRTGELLPESRRSGAAGFGLKRKGTSGAPNADRIPLEGRQSSFCVVR